MPRWIGVDDAVTRADSLVFSKILIADRGSMAVRIARTCERLGIATITVYGDADENAPHVQACGEAVRIPGKRPYADLAAIVAAARERGAQAAHPGAGPLAASAAFAEALSQAGIAFVGAARDALSLTEDRLQTRALAARAGVRAVPAAEVALRDLDAARRAAESFGVPLRVTPVARSEARARSIDDLDALLETIEAVSEDAERACGDGRVHLEPHVERARCLDVQLVADATGVVSLGERESSVRRADQPMLCEQPAPALAFLGRGERRQRALHDAAIAVASEAALRGAATASFLADAAGRIYFVRLDPRLAPDHVTTEMYCGVDLVEEQLRIAAGDGISDAARRAEPTGHAIQASVFAGEPATPGAVVEIVRWPLLPPGSLRVETTLAAGAAVADERPLATVTAFHRTRHQALLTLDRVLAETAIAPLPTNLASLRRLLGDDSFRAGQYDAEFALRFPD